MKELLQTDWGPSLRQGTRVIAHGLALIWTLAVMGRDALSLANDRLAAWWVQVLGVAPAQPAPVVMAAPVAAPPAPTNPPRPERKRQPVKATGKPRPARRRKPKAAPACGGAVPVGMGA